MRPVIETFSGQYVDLINPRAETICITDIAHALSMQARFNGHTVYDKPYSVAMHSVWVSSYCFKLHQCPLMALHGLLHDAAEAYIGDVVTPLKCVPGVAENLAAIEQSLIAVIYEHLNLPLPDDTQRALVKSADAQALSCEARSLMRSQAEGEYWDKLPNIDSVAASISWTLPVDHWQSGQHFLTQFKNLYVQVNGEVEHVIH